MTSIQSKAGDTQLLLPRGSKRNGSTAVLAWTGVILTAVLVLKLEGHSFLSLGLLAVYWLWVILVPGFVIHRWMRPHVCSVVDNLAWAATLGLVAELAVRPLAVSASAPWIFWVWPLLVLAVCCAISSARSRLSVQSLQTAGLRATVLTALATATAVVVLWASYLRTNLVPGKTGAYYQDLMYHLSINRVLQYEVLPSNPQVAGLPLDYHWFANSHMASVSVATGIDPSKLLFHLWLIPILIVTALALCALARQATGSWWIGPLLVVFVLTTTSAIAFERNLPILVGGILVPLSPSQMFVAPLMLAAVSFAIDFLRGTRDVGIWAGLAVLSLAMSGAKPSALPLVGAALAFVLVSQALSNRRIDRGLLGLLAMTGAIWALTQVVASAGSAGSDLRAFGWFRSMPAFRDMAHDETALGSGGWFLESATSARGAWAVFITLLAIVAIHLPKLMGLIALRRRGLRSNPVVQLLAGLVIGMTVPFLFLDHPGFSQWYFLYAATPFGVLLTLWLVRDLALGSVSTIDIVGRSTLVGLVGGCLALGVAMVVPVEGQLVAVRQVGAVLVVACTAALILRRTLRRSIRPHRRDGALLAASVAILAMTLPAWGPLTGRHAYPENFASGRAALGITELTGEEIAAARWLDHRAGPHDIVATNVHCLWIADSDVCSALAFWVSGLSGQKVLLEGWAYTMQNQAQDAAVGPTYQYTSAPWQDRLEMSDNAVQNPDRLLLDRLYATGARWIFADKRASSISPKLMELAELTYRNPTVEVYRLRPPVSSDSRRQ